MNTTWLDKSQILCFVCNKFYKPQGETMRSLKISLLVFILSISVSAQWYWQNPIPGNTYSINKIYFLDGDNGMVIGPGGLIYMTTNGGEAWLPVYTGVSETLIDLDFVNSNFGII